MFVFHQRLNGGNLSEKIDTMFSAQYVSSDLKMSLAVETNAAEPRNRWHSM